jgi:hypothetical protein
MANSTKRNCSAGRRATQNQQKMKTSDKKSGIHNLILLVGKKWPEIVRVGVSLVDIAVRIRDHFDSG